MHEKGLKEVFGCQIKNKFLAFCVTEEASSRGVTGSAVAAPAEADGRNGKHFHQGFQQIMRIIPSLQSQTHIHFNRDL